MGLFRRFISFLRHPEFNSGSLLKKNFTPLQVKKTIQYPSFYARVKDIFSLTRFRKNKINNPKLIAILLGGIFFAFLGGIIYRNQISTFFSSAGADPVSYWKFDEGQGSTAYDSTGSNNGTLGSGASAPTWVSEEQCISGKCLRFDGSGDYIVISQPSIETNPNEFTISGWIKPGNISGYFISPTSVGYDQYLRYDASNSTIGVAIAEATDTNNRTRYSTDNSVPQNSWTYWAVTIDGLDIKIYINGQLNSEYTESISIAGWTSNWVIGARGNRTNWFNGYLDELKVYSYVRSAAQIKADYTSRGSTKGVSASFGTDDTSSKLSDGLVGYWKMDEVGGSALSDSSGNIFSALAFDETIDNGDSDTPPTVANGKFGYSRQFDGTDDYVSVSNFTSNFFRDQSFTVSVWAKRNDTKTSQSLISYRTDGFSPINLAIRGGTIRFEGFGSGSNNEVYRVDAGSTTIGQWHHVVGTFDNNLKKATVFLDGIEVGSTTCENCPVDTTSGKLYFGRDYWNGSLYGNIDEVRIYNRALEPDEVKALYQWAPGPVGWWKFDEGSGSTAVDSSGNGNNGALGVGNSAPTWTQGKFGEALDFDGTGDSVQVGTSGLNAMSGTVSVWAKSRDSGNNTRYIFGHNFSGGNRIYILHLNDGTVRVGLGNNALYTTDVTYSFNQWHHYSLTWNSGTYYFYYDGIQKSTGSYSGLSTIGPTALIGIIGTGYWLGDIDDVRIYNYARTQEQILQDMAGSSYTTGERLTSDMAVLHFSFDEGYGTTVHDVSPQKNNGTFGAGNSAPTWTQDGKFGKALSFDGTNDRVVMPLNIYGYTELSYSAWFKYSANQTSSLVTGNYGRSGLYISSNSVRARAFDTSDNYIASTTNVRDGQWHHAVATYDLIATTTKLYIDGKLEAEMSKFPNILNHGNSYLGENPMTGADGFFNGSIDEVKIYPFALTAEQVKQEYAGGQSLVLGSGSTGVGGTSPSNAASREYCVPGDDAYCAAPVGEWKFEEYNGTTVYDTSTNGNHGTLVGGPKLVLGAQGVGTGVRFDGSGDYAQTGNAPVLDISGTSAITQSVWIKLGSLPVSNPFAPLMITETGQGSTTWDKGIRIHTSGKAAFYVYDGTAKEAVSTTTLSLGKWYFVTGVYDGSNLYIYVNGVLDNASAISASGTFDFSSPQVVFSFSRGNTEATKGIIDEVKIYDYARTPAQIAWEYNRGAPVAHYKFDECQGTTVYDTSVHKNNGTINLGSNGVTSAGTCKTSGAWYNGRNGKRNGSMSFDGSDDYVDINTTVVSNFPLSFSAWVKTSPPGNGAIVNATNPSTNNERISLLFTSGTLQWMAESAPGAANDFEITVSGKNDGKWHHIVGISASESDHRLYVDGFLAGTSNGTVDGFPVVTKHSIGSQHRTNRTSFFNGQIDDVKIFNYALTPEQVKLEYNSGAVRFE